MLKLILLITIGLFISFCSKENPIDPGNITTYSLDTLHNPIKFEVGQKWHYKKRMINIADSGTTVYMPETLTAYYNYEAVKDTIIESESYIIIECDYWENFFNSNLFHSRQAIHLGEDSIKIYQIDAIGLVFDVLLKVKLSSHTSELTNYNSPIYPMVFPLIKDSSWHYRTVQTSVGKDEIRKIYRSMETITVPAGTFETYKIEWVGKETIKKGFDWISSVGIIKRHFDYGEIVIPPIAHSFEICEYMGAYNRIFDTTVSATIKSFVDSHYSNEKFMAYYNFIYTDTSFIFWESNPFSILSYSNEQKIKSDNYYKRVLQNNLYAQGWDDVLPDMVKDSFQFIKQQNFGTNIDYRFRGYAIDTIIFYNNTIVDTLWLYYDDSKYSEKPKRFGQSAMQDRAGEIRDSLLQLLN